MHQTSPLCLLLFAAAAPAQESLLFAVDSSEHTLDLAGGLLEAGRVRPDEVGLVTPRTGGGYSARAFLSLGAQWAYLGDANQDGRLVDDGTRGPGEATDAIMVKRRNPQTSFGPDQIFFSKAGHQGFASSFKDGDVFRYGGQGVLEQFITEVQLLDALGQSSMDDLDLDAICQTIAGDLAVSFRGTETVSGVAANDGAVVMIPVSGISYDSAGNVLTVVPGSAVIFASELDMGGLILASGVRGANGATPATAFDLSALELDPAGGNWVSPQNSSFSLPNLLFAWTAGDGDGAVLSTAAGGRIAGVNGVPMGSTTATTGLHLGLLPGTTGVDGLGGLALIPNFAAPPVVVENHPTNLILQTSGLYTRQEVSGAMPGALVFFAIDLGPSGPGAALPIRNLPPFGRAFGVGVAVTVGFTTADSRGYCSRGTLLPGSAVGLGINVAWQVFDFGTLRLSTPAAMQLQ